jgi:hypothetical protein
MNVESNANTTLTTAILCTNNTTIPINRDSIPSNEIKWGYGNLTNLSPGLKIDYDTLDKYIYHTGQGTSDCSGAISATIDNFIFGSFGWGKLIGTFNTSIKKTEFVITGDTCPSCGTKYMDVKIQVPLMLCS